MGISSFLTNLIYNDFADDDSEVKAVSENPAPEEKSDIIEIGVTALAILPDLSVSNQLEPSIPAKAKVYAAE